MKIQQKQGDKGSLKWIQTLVNKNSDLLNEKIKIHIGNDSFEIQWLSPLKHDNYAEYRDKDFLKILGLQNFNNKLSEFWPERGPQWDALGKSNSNHYFLVEAKANIPEITSSCFAKADDSIIKIQRGIGRTKEYLKASSGKNWFDGFYQYANRLCHLYFLREFCGVNAYMIFIYFCNDQTHIPTEYKEWTGALNLQKHLMSLKRHKLQRYVIDIFIDVKTM